MFVPVICEVMIGLKAGFVMLYYCALLFLNKMFKEFQLRSQTSQCVTEVTLSAFYQFNSMFSQSQSCKGSCTFSL